MTTVFDFEGCTELYGHGSIVVCIPYKGRKLRKYGTSYFKGVESVMLVDEMFTGYYPNSFVEEISFPEYVGYLITEVSISNDEVQVRFSNNKGV